MYHIISNENSKRKFFIKDRNRVPITDEISLLRISSYYCKDIYAHQINHVYSK